MRVKNLLRPLATAFFLFFTCRSSAQTDIYANYVTDSSADFQNSYRVTDPDHTNYAYISNLLTLLSSSYLRVGFPVNGQAGDVINIEVQGTGQVLSASLLNSITVRLYDSLGNNVANGSGNGILQLSLLSGANNIYAVRFLTNPTDNYRFKEARIEFNNLLTANLLNEFRVYNIFYQQPCPPVVANSVYAYGTNTALSGYVTNAQNAVDANPVSYATLNDPLNVLVLPPAYLDLAFPKYGHGGDFVGFTVGAASSLLSLSLLQNINITVYDEHANVVAGKNGFGLADLKLLSGTTNEYTVGFVTPSGLYNIAHARITLNGVVSLLEDLNVYNAFHYRIDRPPVVILSSGGSTVCAGGSITLTAFDSLGGTQFLWNTGATTPSITVSTSGTYSVQVTDSLSCSRASIPATITVKPPYTPTIAGDTVLCPGAAGILHTSQVYSSYLWSNGSTSASLPISATGRYYVTVTDSNGCTGTDTATVRKNNINTIASITNAGCSNTSTGAIALNTVGGSGNYSYTWSNGGTVANQNNLSPGIYDVTIRDNGYNCSINRAFTVTSTNSLTAKASVINTTDSNRSDGSITVNVSGGSGNYTYIWSNGGNTTTINGVPAGIYFLTVTDAINGCQLRDTLLVSDGGSNPLTLTTSVTQTTGCNTFNGSATVTATGGSGNYSYLWDNGATTATVAGLSAGTHYVVVTDNTTHYSKGILVVVPNGGILTVGGTVTASDCNAHTGAISPIVTGGSGNYTYNWSNGASTATVSNLQPGIYILNVTDNVSGCTQQHVFDVGAAGGPAATVSVNNGNVTVTTVPGGYNYLWSNGASTANQNNLSPGIYTLTIIDTATGCSSIYTVVIPTVQQLLLTATQTNNSSCTSTGNGAISLIVTGGTAPYIYSWSNGANTASISNLSNGTYTATVHDASGLSNSITIHIITDTLRALHVSVSHVTYASCSNVANGGATVDVSGGQPPYSFSWTGGVTTQNLNNVLPGLYNLDVSDAQGCTVHTNVLIPIDSTQIVHAVLDSIVKVNCISPNSGAIYVHATNGTTPYSYTWSNGNNSSNLLQATVGSYTITVTDAIGCTASLSANVDKVPALHIASQVTNEKCYGDNMGSIAVSVDSGSGTYTYAWDNGTASANIDNLSSGTYNIQVTDTKTGCMTNTGITVTQPDSLNITANVSNVTCIGNDGALDLAVLGGTPPYVYQWSTGILTSQLNGLYTGNYTVTVTDANSCHKSAIFTVGKADCNGILNVHNVITPNGDGMNDYWVIEGIDNYPSSSVMVFDKWGDVVFQQSAYKNNWNGVDNSNKPLAGGTYYYLLKLNAPNIQGKSEYTGFIMIQR